ncbi:PE-PGRS family protein [Persicitalea sp.]|uniref:PE-PGRS family protein n=1 Tax=Persicitalea sp. TaxID=3100273 RepID=UPI003593C67E
MKSSASVRFSLLLLLGCLTACWEKDPAPDPGSERSDQFAIVPDRFPVAPGQMDEASGLADSRNFAGYLWTHEDSGSPAELLLLSHDGKEVRRYRPPGIANYDWEDIAVGGGPEKDVNYLYVGDIGINDVHPDPGTHTIIRIPELNNPNESFAADRIAKLRFRFPNNNPDAETLLFDPVTKDLFVVSKELESANLYRFAYPQSTDGTTTLEHVGKIPALLLATGGDISADGQEVLVRNYTNIYYWKRKSGETIGQTLMREANKPVPYALEPQGEAVCFDREMKGYYTLSEKRNAQSVSLQYFRRK